MEFLDFSVALLIAALAGMGIGGGGLLVIWLVLVRDMPAQTAQSINLLFFVVSAVFALPIHKNRRSLPVRRLAFLSVAAVPGVLLGCHLASVLSEAYTRKCFGYFLLISGAMQLYRQIKTRFSLDYPNES